MKKSYEIDMCNGPLLGKLLIFALPLMLSGILQLLFNAADIIVVGRFTGSHALAAVGSTSSLINLLVNLFIGFSIGANVLTAQYYGAKDQKNIHQTIHTSILISLIGGIILIAVGVLLARPLLELMATPEDVLDQATLYMKIYFCGMPATMVYNFGAAILRAIGDTRRPLYFLFTAGVLNVFLNLFFVIVFHMGVAGVALATIISQTLSAILVVRCLTNLDGICRLYLKQLKIYPEKLLRIVQNRSSCRTAGRCVFYLQRIDPVLRQFLRFHCNGRKHGGIQPGRVRLYVNERGISDCFKLYQPEYWCRQISANRYDSSALRGSRNHHWTGSRRTCCSVSSASAQHLFHRP